MIQPRDEEFLRLAIELAWQARRAGNEPFGALLVRDGVVVHRATERSRELNDPTYHAELALISEYCRQTGTMSLAGCTMYASAEPCPMCAGAIHWARVSRVVFSATQAMIQEISGGRPKPAAEPIINMGKARAEVIGPLLPEEGRAVFEGFLFGRKGVPPPCH